MPRLQINRKGTIPLSSLIHIFRRIIKHFQHRHNPSRLAVRAVDVRVLGANVVNRQTNTTRPLGNLGTITQRLVDALDRVRVHRQQETAGKLRVLGSGVKQSGSCVDEVAQRQSIVGLLHAVKVGLVHLGASVKLESHTHPHVLRTLTCLSVARAKQIALLQSLEAKIVKVEVARIVNHCLNLLGKLGQVPHIILRDQCILRKAVHTLPKSRGRILLVVINHDTSSQTTIVRMMPCLHHRTCLRSKLV